MNLEKLFESNPNLKYSTTVFIDENLRPFLELVKIPDSINLVKDELISHFKIIKSDNVLNLFEKNIYLFSLPIKTNNIEFFLNYISKLREQNDKIHFLNNHQKKFLTVQKSLFSHKESKSDLTPNNWTELIHSSHQIAKNSQSLIALIENLFQIPIFKNFSTILCIFHGKGSADANIFGVRWKSERYIKQFPTKHFNLIFNTIKKSKNKTFVSDATNIDILSFTGSFLAQEISSKKFNLILTASRNDFLNFSRSEIEIFNSCVNFLGPHLLKLIDKEFSSNSIAELRACFNYFPAPLRLRNYELAFELINDKSLNNLIDSDIILTQSTNSGFILDIFESEELRSYAFDLFHFQRVSLLGELLNTLRHELSNPLFGINLGIELCFSNNISDDQKEILKEIQKNITRCQSIIENFSSLYLSSSKKEEITLGKILKETLAICKSETREISIETKFIECDENLAVNQPLLSILQILFNLIINSSQSIKNQKEKGFIRIEISQNENFVFILVQDNGSGISDEKKHFIFQPFFTTKKNGTGLGLILSRNLAQKMGGNLEHLPSDKHKLTTFNLTLPKK